MTRWTAQKGCMGSACTPVEVSSRSRCGSITELHSHKRSCGGLTLQPMFMSPPEANMVADHAKRALSAYPRSEGYYYGVDYAQRGLSGVPDDELPAIFLPAHAGGKGPSYAPNDLSWYANIPVPTSYMCVATDKDFFGGYDYFKEAGLIHVADHHISPGKKQWTWGNHDFGYAWDRNLTDSDGPYIELMAGVYTDNQPDFSFIGPWETKTFSQYLYPYQKIGPALYANLEVAISSDGKSIGVASTSSQLLNIVAENTTKSLEWKDVKVDPTHPFKQSFEKATRITVFRGAVCIGQYDSEDTFVQPLESATEPPLANEIESSDELYLTGLHLAQYRHATRKAVDYWQEALKRDPGDSRCNNAIGLWRLRRGEFELAKEHFQTAIKRLTKRNPNPYDGEPYYNLGLTLRFLKEEEGAERAFAKACWNVAWKVPAHLALAELSASHGSWADAMSHLDQVLQRDGSNLRALNLRTTIRREMGLSSEDSASLQHDPLDVWGRYLAGLPAFKDNQMRIDLALDLASSGFYDQSVSILDQLDLNATDGSVPLGLYHKAYFLKLLGSQSMADYKAAMNAQPDYCFPSRLEDLVVLESAPESDFRAKYYLGNLLYDKGRHEEAIASWEKAVAGEPSNSVAHRNLGIAYFNVRHDAQKALDSYEAALAASPNDARLWFERDQLWKRVGRTTSERTCVLESRKDLVLLRDDLTIEFCDLLNDDDRPDEAEKILQSRRFQPWEGGEGMALGVYVRTQLALGHRCLLSGNANRATAHFENALTPPQNLGEARHLLANASDVWLAMGDACAATGQSTDAKKWWLKAAEFKGDFQEMAVQPFSEFTYFQAVALVRLGRTDEAKELLRRLGNYADELAKSEAKIDYFATSLPTMLLFEDDLQARQNMRAKELKALSEKGLS